jgi:ADP-heptose:LPS heptosyltransferase
MASRFWPRAYALTLGAAALALPGKRRKPETVRRMLIVHHLLFGDTIMLAPLLKKARAIYPHAEIVVTTSPAYAPVFAGRPYGVDPVPLQPRSLAQHRALRRRRGFDLALVPGDNRWSWLARACAARWIVALTPDRRSYKDWPVDELKDMPQAPTAWGEVAASLLSGPDPTPYTLGEWPAPEFRPFELPNGRLCILHLGARNPNRYWPAERWRALIYWAEERGYRVVLTTGPEEKALAAAVDPEGRRSSLVGRLDLAQLWELMRHAAFLVCPDTGIAHLARLVGIPTVAIYGQGSPITTGPGKFWADSPFKALWDPDVSCRDQDDFFGRRLVWVRQCARSPKECADPFCIRRIAVDQVTRAIEDLLTRT